MSRTPEGISRRGFIQVMLAGLGGFFFNEYGVKPACRLFQPPQETDMKYRDGMCIIGEQFPLFVGDRAYRVQLNSSAVRNTLETIAQDSKGEAGREMLGKFLEKTPLRIRLFSDRSGHGNTMMYSSSLYDNPNIDVPTAILSLYLKCIRDPLRRERDLSWIEKKYIIHELYHCWQDINGTLKVVNNSIVSVGGAVVAAGVDIGRRIGPNNPIASSLVGGVGGMLAMAEASEVSKRKVIENISLQEEHLYGLDDIQKHKGKFFQFQEHN